MKSRSDIISSLQHLKMAKDHFESFILDNPGSNGAKLFIGYKKRIDWIFNDLVTNPSFSKEVRNGIFKEMNSDAFAVPAISEKVALLSPEQREIIENVIDKVISGDQLLVN